MDLPILGMMVGLDSGYHIIIRSRLKRDHGRWKKGWKKGEKAEKVCLWFSFTEETPLGEDAATISCAVSVYLPQKAERMQDRKELLEQYFSVLERKW